MDVALDKMYAFHTIQQADATLFLHPNDHPYDSDLVEIDKKGVIIGFHSKPHPKNFYIVILSMQPCTFYLLVYYSIFLRELSLILGKIYFQKYLQKI